MHNIYSPEVRREAMRFGITELQAYRRLKTQAELQRSELEHRNNAAKARRGIYK